MRKIIILIIIHTFIFQGIGLCLEPLTACFRSEALRPMAAKFIQKDLNSFKELDPDYVKSVYYSLYKKRGLTGDIQWLINHIETGRYVALSIAERFNLTVEEREKIAIAFNFHDIGKLYSREIWTSIFASDRKFDLKNDLLTRQKVDSHSLYVVDTLNELGINLEEDINILIRFHHIPSKIKDARLRFLREIIALADVVNAVTSNRPYNLNQRYLSLEEVLTIIESDWQQKFDEGYFLYREVYDAFLDFVSTDNLWRHQLEKCTKKLPNQSKNIRAINSAA